MFRVSRRLDYGLQLMIALSKDATLQERLETNIGRFAVADADRIIAEEILKTIGK